MHLKGLIDQDVVNYKKTSMFLATCICDWKCCTQLNKDICLCQNSPIASQKTINYGDQKIIKRYLKNKLTSAIVIAGLQPFKQFQQIFDFIKKFREVCNDDIVIYTGYYQSQVSEQLQQLQQFDNIIVKFGRYKPNQQSHYDQVLGVMLANDQQYGKKLININNN